jgi:hypothetical protein
MKKITLKGLADYVTANDLRRQRIVKEYKYPKDDEPRAKILYYKEAKDRIRRYHGLANVGPEWLATKATELEAESALRFDRGRTRLKHNARALRAYARNFAARTFEVCDDKNLVLKFGDITIGAKPDMVVVERGKTKLVRFDFSEKEPEPKLFKVLAQGTFEAALAAGIDVPSSCVLILDVPRGREYRGARMGARMRREMEAACQGLSAIWDMI